MASIMLIGMVEFQFQYGLIKRVKLLTKEPATKEFQFQYGLIKSRQFRIFKEDKHYFNSNMV